MIPTSAPLTGINQLYLVTLRQKGLPPLCTGYHTAVDGYGDPYLLRVYLKLLKESFYVYSGAERYRLTVELHAHTQRETFLLSPE